MQINAIIVAVVIVAAGGTWVSHLQSKQVTVNAGPGVSKFITVHKSAPGAQSDQSGIGQRLSNWLSGDETAGDVRIMSLSADRAAD